MVTKQTFWIVLLHLFSFKFRRFLSTVGLSNEDNCCQLQGIGKLIKVHLTPKYFFRLNNSLHLFETNCAFLPLFSPILDFLQAAKVKKSGHHLLHGRASKGYESIPGLMSQTSLHACLQRLNTM